MDLAGIPYLREIDRPVERGLRADPNFPLASEAIADKVSDPVAVMVGVPFGGGSLSGAKCEQTPAAIRGMLSRFSAYSSDFDVALEIASVLDAGDVDARGDVEEVERRVEVCVRALAAAGDGVPLAVVGGDNSITAGAVAGAGADALITFDAHHDVRDGATNGSPVRRLIDAGLPGERVVQIGIHGFANSRAYSQRAASFGIRWVPATAVRARGIAAVLSESLDTLGDARRIWCDFDIDVLDRAFAPGTAASMPGGLWPADLEQAAFALGAHPRVCGMDVTEVDPSADVAGTTVRAACAVLLSYLAGVTSR